jgi:hypothetical protein
MNRLAALFLCCCVVRAFAADADKSLLTHLTFEDRSATPVDSSGSGTKTSLIGRAGYGRGVEGSSAILLKDGAHLKLENRKAYGKETEAMTLAFWVKADDFPAKARLIQKGNLEDEWQVEINYKGEFVWSVFTKKPVQVYTRPPATREWVHIAVTFDRGHGRVYFNGQVANQRKIEDCGAIYYSRRPVIIGGGWNKSEQTEFTFDGFFDDVRFYNRALSREEIVALTKR